MYYVGTIKDTYSKLFLLSLKLSSVYVSIFIKI